MNNLLTKSCTTIRCLHPFLAVTPAATANVSSCNRFQLRRLSNLIVNTNIDQRQRNRDSSSPGHLVFGESQYIQCRNAGHSKWANIKHQKSVVDQQKATEIDRYIRAIRNAAKEHKSADPKLNKALADAIDRAKSARVPSATIQKALEYIARGLNKSGDFKKLTQILRGPGGCVMITLMETDHVNKLKMDLTPIIRKHGFTIGTDSLFHLFDTKGIILCTGLKGKPLTEEQLEECVEHAIEAEAEEVTWTESPLYGNVMEFTCEPDNFYKVSKNLEALNYEIVYSEVDYLPKTLVELEDNQLELVAKFHQKLQDNADVLKIYDNIA